MSQCMYCPEPGVEREPLSTGEPVYVCVGCWKVLQNPQTALPFLRGHLTLQLRGTMPEAELQKQLNAFMAHAAKMKRPG